MKDKIFKENSLNDLKMIKNDFLALVENQCIDVPKSIYIKAAKATIENFFDYLEKMNEKINYTEHHDN